MLFFYYFPEDYISHVFAFCQIEIFCASSLWQQKTFFNTVCNCSITSVGPNLFQSVENFFKSVLPNLLLRMKSNWGTALAKRPCTSRSEYLNIWEEESFRIHFTKLVLLFLSYRFSYFAERERIHKIHLSKLTFL